MLRSFKALIMHREAGAERTQGVAPLRFFAYHGHREMMYALAAFFDIRYNITYPALPLGAIPPATSLFFELHSVDHHRRRKAGRPTTRKAGKGKGKGRAGAAEEEDEDVGEAYEVKAVLWSPCDADEGDDARLLLLPAASVDSSAVRPQLLSPPQPHPRHPPPQPHRPPRPLQPQHRPHPQP